MVRCGAAVGGTRGGGGGSSLPKRGHSGVQSQSQRCSAWAAWRPSPRQRLAAGGKSRPWAGRRRRSQRRRATTRAQTTARSSRSRTFALAEVRRGVGGFHGEAHVRNVRVDFARPVFSRCAVGRLALCGERGDGKRKGMGRTRRLVAGRKEAASLKEQWGKKNASARQRGHPRPAHGAQRDAGSGAPGTAGRAPRETQGGQRGRKGGSGGEGAAEQTRSPRRREAHEADTASERARRTAGQ